MAAVKGEEDFREFQNVIELTNGAIGMSAGELQQMADNVNGGNHLPLIFNHDMRGIPVGRVFKARTVMDEKTGEVELRSLFRTRKRRVSVLAPSVETSSW